MTSTATSRQAWIGALHALAADRFGHDAIKKLCLDDRPFIDDCLEQGLSVEQALQEAIDATCDAATVAHEMTMLASARL